MKKMRTFHLNKLVRDKIVAYMKEQGQLPEYRVLSRTATLEALRTKLVEEASEMTSHRPEEMLSELADIQEVLDSLLALAGISKSELHKKQTEKRLKSGSFKKGLYVGKLQVPDHTEWSKYYAREPERFPEDS